MTAAPVGTCRYMHSLSPNHTKLRIPTYITTSCTYTDPTPSVFMTWHNGQSVRGWLHLHQYSYYKHIIDYHSSSTRSSPHTHTCTHQTCPSPQLGVCPNPSHTVQCHVISPPKVLSHQVTVQFVPTLLVVVETAL